MKWDALWAERELSRSTGPATTVFFADNGEVEVANVDPRFVHATLAASKSLGVGIAQPLDESGEVSDPLVFINLIDSGGSWKGTYSELADRLGVGVAE